MRIVSQELLTLLFNSLWQIALIAAAATLCARLLRNTKAGTRHLLWVAALVAPVFLAAVTLWLGARQSLFPLKPAAANLEFSQAVSANGLPLSLSTDGTPPMPSPAKTIPVSRTVALTLLVGYGLLFAYRSIQLLRAWLKTRAIVRGANEADVAGHIKEIIGRCVETIGIAKIRVLWSPSIAVPVTIGAMRPVVILPEKMLGERDADLLTTALGHELAHVRRKDYALNLLYELLYVPISFHPAAAWVKRRIRQTREQRCDEVVTEKLLNAAAYARSLVKMAGWATRINYSTPTISVGIADAGNLEERIMSILRKPRKAPSTKILMIAAASLLFVVPCVVAAQHAMRIIILPDPPAVPAIGIPPSEEVSFSIVRSSNGQLEERVNPVVIYSTRPEYTKDARKNKIHGEVKLEVTIGTDGVARDIKVTQPLYPSLDESAVTAIREWKFAPAMKDGKPVEKRIPISVSFNLFDGNGDGDRGYAERVQLDNEAREKAEQALLEAQRQEINAQREKEDQAVRLEQDQKLRALEQQIQDLERSKEKAAAANDTEAMHRAEDEIAQIENMLTNQKREEELLQQETAREKGVVMYFTDGQKKLGKFVIYGPDGRTEITDVAQSQAELAKRVKIPMSKAIEVATKDHPGTVVNCELRGGPDQVFYAITIVSGDEHLGHRVTELVSAIDGKLLAGRGR
ncbi:MAG: TonB family protein [Candidatus Acidiferrales bacterium]